MQTTQQLAKHLREVHFGGNWTWSNLKDNLADISWQEATTQVHSLNTIALLTFHVNYYVVAVNSVLEGKPIEAHDKYSYDCPPIQSQEDWVKLRDKVLQDAEKMAKLTEQLADEKLWEVFVVEKYGNYFRNLMGVLEHTHYHLGQIAVIKKIVKSAAVGI